MPPIDPERLLRTLSPLLNPRNGGGIKSTVEVDKIFGLMSKFSKKLVSKVIYINILKSTPSDILDYFMQRGGWDMIYNWANEAQTRKNNALLREIFYLLCTTPTNVNRLRENDLPKLIKVVARDSESDDTKEAAREVYEKWLALAQESNAAASAAVVAEADESTIAEQLVLYETNTVDPTILIEADPQSGNFDLTQYITSADLNIGESDFNPDVFNSAVDEHLLDEIDGSSSANSTGPQMLNIEGAQIDDEEDAEVITIDPSNPTLCFVGADGKKLLFKVRVAGEEDLSKKGERIVKKKNAPGGKPSLKTYAAKTKLGTLDKGENSTSTLPPSSGLPNFYGKKEKNTPPPPPTSPDKEAKLKEKERTREKKISKHQSNKERIAAREAESERLRLKVLEQKKIRDQRNQQKKDELEKKQKEKDEETLKSLNLALPLGPSKIPKIPKKTQSFSDMIAIPGANSAPPSKNDVKNKLNKNKGEKASTSPPDSVKSSIKEEVEAPRSRGRPKVYNSGKSRSQGLLAEMEQTIQQTNEKKQKNNASGDKSKIKDIDPDVDVIGKGGKKTKRLSQDPLESPNSKKPKTEEKEKEKEKKEKEEKKSEKDKKNAKGSLQESSFFMDAINAESVAPSRSTRSKRRLSSSNETVKDSTKEAETPPPLPPPLETKPVFNFYRDTLNEETTSGGEEVKNSPKETSSDSKREEVKKEEEEEMDTTDPFVPQEGEGRPKSCLVIHRSRNRSKKSVSWREDEDLKEYHYFDLDETERVNVSRQVKNFTEMKLIERNDERKHIAKRNKQGVVDNMEEKMMWTPPVPVIFEVPPPEVPIYSYEKLVQEERERGILEVFYFSKTQIPDSPVEPEEHKPSSKDEPTKTIPLEDITGVTVTKEFKFEPLSTQQRGYSTSSTGGTAGQSLGSPLIANANFLNALAQAQQAGIPTTATNVTSAALDPNTLAQMQFTAWSMAAAAASGMTSNGDIWANAQQMAALAASSQLPPPFGYTSSSAPPSSQLHETPHHHEGYSTTPPDPHSSSYHHHHHGQHIANNSKANNGFGGGGRGRGGRASRWDDMRRPEESRKEGFNSSNYSSGFRGRGGHGEWGERGGRGGGGFRGGRGGATEPRNRNGAPRTVLCKFFQQGYCKSGEDCDFLHPGINGPTRPSRFNSRFSSTPDGHEPNSNPSSNYTRSVTSSSPSESSEAKFTQPPSSPTNETEVSVGERPKVIPVGNDDDWDD